MTPRSPSVQNGSAVSHVEEGDGRLTLTFRQPSRHHLDEFLRLRCAPDLVGWDTYPNTKEITESFGAYAAVRAHLWSRFAPRDPSVLLVAVGDGSTPRTAVTFAMRSQWSCVSIDPKLREAAAWEARVRRLHCLPQRVEEVTLEAERAVIVAVHSHADLAAAVRAVRARVLAVVAMPCCVPQALGVAPSVSYADWAIWSPHRTVSVWMPEDVEEVRRRDARGLEVAA